MAIASDEGWRAAALETIRRIAVASKFLSSGDVWDHLDEIKPSEPRLMGAVFEKAYALGYITITDRIWNSRRRSSHGRPVRVWQSNIFLKE